MIIIKKQIDALKVLLRRRVKYLYRNLDKNFKPLRFNKKKLALYRSYYDNIVNSVVEDMINYHNSYIWHLENKEKKRFDNYTILSYNGDRMGKVFLREGRIYRGIYKESLKEFYELWNTGLLQVLSKRKYIPNTTLTDFYTDEYPIFIEHEVVDISTSKLWTRSMIIDACQLMCLIQQIANSVGFTLQDGHLNNVTFHNGRPIFTDIGSIVKNVGQITSHSKELVFAGLYRLVFSDVRNSILNRVQVYDEDNNSIWIHPRFYDDITFEYYQIMKMYKRYHRFHSSRLCNKVIYNVFDKYDVKPEYIELLFSNEIDTGRVSIDKYKSDILCITSMLGKFEVELSSVIDVGGTCGELPISIYNKLKIKVKTTENNDVNSELTYKRMKNEKQPISVVLYNYLYGSSRRDNTYLKSDIAIAIDITNNLLSYQDFKLDSLFNSLAKLSNKYVALTYHTESKTSCEVDEEISNFKKSFSQFFYIIEESDFTQNNNEIKQKKILLIGEKKYS